ncbi:MAG TPA: hypothetical protein VJ836_00830 [Candidatus Saccharimonadales bacterium]|nr:hypothetical protein [Candidatus Saccharimonadales bacterium]
MDSPLVVLFQYGLAGVVILGQTVAIRFLYNENKLLNKEVNAQVDARRLDARETLEKVEGPLSSLAQSTKFIADKLISVKKD